MAKVKLRMKGITIPAFITGGGAISPNSKRTSPLYPPNISMLLSMSRALKGPPSSYKTPKNSTIPPNRTRIP
ncbi:hypothetical protein [Archaeoglobus profundus]|uniref:hypothetical protein n=1 Tax=Archaeoglobus profundus TaxID=84156 RepID=UPI0024783C21|nr:hypothetical protein [Archaeoglobus profundus]